MFLNDVCIIESVVIQRVSEGKVENVLTHSDSGIIRCFTELLGVPVANLQQGVAAVLGLAAVVVAEVELEGLANRALRPLELRISSYKTSKAITHRYVV